MEPRRLFAIPTDPWQQLARQPWSYLARHHAGLFAEIDPDCRKLVHLPDAGRLAELRAWILAAERRWAHAEK